MAKKIKQKKRVNAEEILEKAKKYCASSEVADTEEGIAEEHVGEECKPKRKATEADLERKREKNRLKRKMKKKAKSGKKITEEEMKAARERAVAYLHKWQNDRSSWSFQKNVQKWLLKNAFSKEKISEDDFKILLEYLIDLKGIARDRLLVDSEKIVKRTEMEQINSQPEDCFLSPDLEAYKRARLVIQTLV